MKMTHNYAYKLDFNSLIMPGLILCNTQCTIR